MKEGHSLIAVRRRHSVEFHPFISLFTPSHLLFLCSYHFVWPLTAPGPVLTCLFVSEAHILATNIRDYLSHHLRRANRTAGRLSGIYWQPGGRMHLSNSRMCYRLMVAPLPLYRLAESQCRGVMAVLQEARLQCCGPFPSLPRTA